MYKIGVVGFGYWGPNLARNFSLNPLTQVKTIVDLDRRNLKKAKNIYPHVLVTDDLKKVLSDPEIFAVAVATPIRTHFEIVKKCLSGGKHVFSEKPLTTSIKQANELYKLADKKKVCLFADYVYLYNGAVRHIKKIIDAGGLGDINYFDAVRVNLGLFQGDSNVLWDLAVHDLSILAFLIKEMPFSVIASGVSHTQNTIENIVYVTLKYKTGLLSHLHCSWTAPLKVRRIMIGGSRKMIVYDDVEPTEKVKVYDAGYNIVDREKLQVDYRRGDINVPKFDRSEALYSAVSQFIKFAAKAVFPEENRKIGMAVICLLEGAQRSLKKNGKEVVLEWNS